MIVSTNDQRPTTTRVTSLVGHRFFPRLTVHQSLRLQCGRNPARTPTWSPGSALPECVRCPCKSTVRRRQEEVEPCTGLTIAVCRIPDCRGGSGTIHSAPIHHGDGVDAFEGLCLCSTRLSCEEFRFVSAAVVIDLLRPHFLLPPAPCPSPLSKAARSTSRFMVVSRRLTMWEISSIPRLVSMTVGKPTISSYSIRRSRQISQIPTDASTGGATQVGLDTRS